MKKLGLSIGTAAVLGGFGYLASALLTTNGNAQSTSQGGSQQQPAAVQQQPPKTIDATAADEILTKARAQLMDLTKDKKYVHEDVMKIIAQYETLKNYKVDDKAGTQAKDLYTKVIGEYEKAIGDAFNERDIYAYIGIVTDKATGNRPGNLGGVKPLYVGKGKDVADKLSDIGQKIELLRKERPAWKPYPVGKNLAINENEVYATSVGVDKETMEKVLKARTSFGKRDDAEARYLDMGVWNRLHNGSAEFDAEARDGHYRFMAVYRVLKEAPKAEPKATK